MNPSLVLHVQEISQPLQLRASSTQLAIFCSPQSLVRVKHAMIVAPSRTTEGGLTFALQALLNRHESYMAESEEGRSRMAASMERLANDKRILETRNAIVTQENQDLLQQLECMNVQIADSDAHIQSLMATLSAAQFENKRLLVLASRTAELEAQLTAMEIGQSRLQEELKTTEEDERSAVLRWQHAETRLQDLNDQIQKMEEEARDERDKHAEIFARMEQRRTVEKDMGNAAGRINGSATTSAFDPNTSGTNVVSHFVRDILRDNANLQAGIVELRELLQASNDEVQTLRDQVLRHQPITTEHELNPASLMDEIKQCRPQTLAQEVHVHHHYHAKVTAKKERVPSMRRPPRRRGPVSSGSNSSDCQTLPSKRESNMMAIPRPLNRIDRLSTQSLATEFSTASSLPSSPYSENRSSSIFDCIDAGFESSRPTSPESASYPSTRFQFKQQRLQPAAQTVNLTDVKEDESLIMDAVYPRKGHCAETEGAQNVLEQPDAEGVPPCVGKYTQLPSAQPPQSQPNRLISHYRSEEVDSIQPANALEDVYLDRPLLRRSNSQESLMSISGMDILLPQNRKPRLCLRPRPSATLETPDPLALSIAFPSSKPLASIAEVHASSSNLASPTTNDSLNPISLLSGLASGKPSQPAAKSLGRLVGGWVKGRWSVAPMPSAGHAREEGASGDSFSRAPGINQRGPIVGWKPPVRAPSEVQAKLLNPDLLKESLVE
jgi:hypothetical protein